MKNSEMFIPIVDDGSVAFTLCRSDPEGKNVFQYSEVLADLKNAKQFRAVSYNISTNEKDSLLKTISDATEGLTDIKIVIGLGDYSYINYKNNRREYQKQLRQYFEILNKNLQNQRIRVAFNGYNHAKIIGTENVLYVGSQNLTQASCSNYESGVIIRNPIVIKNIYDEMFEDLWSKSIECILDNSKHIQFYADICAILKDIESVIDDICIFEISSETFYNEDYVELNFDCKDFKTRVEKYQKIINSFSEDYDTIRDPDIESATDSVNQKFSAINDESLFDEIIEQIEDLQSSSLQDLVNNWMVTNKGQYYDMYNKDAIESVSNEIDERINDINALLAHLKENIMELHRSLDKLKELIIYKTKNPDELERLFESADF
ncbi:phospholipase D-like domain-containing protein [Ruminococcus sp. XPD3002]|uniref:phospholipase D-like domain-containing protein n=1 Tax=Ruminococcus sp. XPD3002 TaxID=1452269 RepID=UPI00090FED5A|nr:PLD-like domain-containing protein [Ruminococcus flavefaciens]